MQYVVRFRHSQTTPKRICKCKVCGKKTKQSNRCKSCSNRERKGYKISEEARKSYQGERNHQWMGDKVGMCSLHEWIRNHKSKTNSCERCNSKPPFDLANISGEYKRDVNDFEWLCRKCHMISDGRMNNLKQYMGDKN